MLAAAFPKMNIMLKTFGKPYELDSPTTIWRIRKDTRLQKYWRTRRQRLLGGRQLLRMIQRLEDYS